MNIESTVWQCLLKAVQRFNQSGDRRTLLCPRHRNAKTKTENTAASERAIAYRLGFYLECELREKRVVSDFGPIVTDCEYNRHIAAGKSLAAEAEEEIKKIVKKARKKDLEADEEGFYVFSIAPDIVVHQRQTDVNNFLVVEVKKRSNPETERYDNLKLELFTKPKEDHRGYGYKLGAWVVAEDELPLGERKLVIRKAFQNGNGEDLRNEW
jgi:hypothetical protein